MEPDYSKNEEANIAFFERFKNHPCGPAVNAVIQNPDFQIWSGSGDPIHHHYGDGGLLQHTREVCNYVLHVDLGYREMGGKKEELRMNDLITACVWHDYGKLWDYQKVGGVWGKHNDHAREIHHISRSAIEFQRFAIQNLKAVKGLDVEHITHLILSHHGRREWGSPVSPHTREAWILHLADGLSARINDCDTYNKF